MQHSPSSKKHTSGDMRSQSKSTIGDFSDRTAKDLENFEDHMSRLHSIEFPALSPDDSLKNRITTVEHFCEIQSLNNQLTYETLGDTKNILNNAETNLMDGIEQIRLKFQNDLNTLKREYDHRFELQMAENKRLQSR